MRFERDHHLKRLRQHRQQVGVENEERLIILTVYKKESQVVPQAVLDRARDRKRRYETK